MDISGKRILLLFIGLMLLVTMAVIVKHHHIFITKPAAESLPLEPTIDSLQIAAPPPTMLYGFVVDSMVIIEGKIKRNQNLSDILSSYNVSPEVIHELAKKSQKVFDVRKIGIHKKYTLICQPDSFNTAKCLVYEPNPLEYIVFDLNDTLQVYRTLRKVDTLERTMGGYITKSLYQDMVDKGASPQLVNDLVDVFGWQVDFFRVQKGDKFKLIYEETQVEGEFVGLGKVIGGYFEHFGNEYYAINYDQGKGHDFFDLEGNSLRKAFLRAPIEYTRISSRYSGRRYHPVLKRHVAHLGTDYAAPIGTPIRAVGDGTISEAAYGKYNGNFVKIKHNGTYSTQYLHMHKITRGIRPGVRVKKGQIIGYVGRTGLANGSHVCYRFWKNGKQVDALKVYIPPSQPIEEQNKFDFNYLKENIKTQLDYIPISPKTPKLLATSR